jgi:FkbM family methyltransferase
MDSIRKSLGLEFLSPIQQFAYHGYDDVLYKGVNLDKDSTIVVLGGYEGLSTEQWYDTYNCNIYVYEPIVDFYQHLVSKFKNNNAIHLFNYAVSNFSGDLVLKIEGEKTGSRAASDISVKVKTLDILQVIGPKVSLLEVNIEGGEYEVLERILYSRCIDKIEILQIQFHKFDLRDELRRAEIRNQLALTHVNIFDFPWIWERWVLKTSEF